jgi:AraC-like DNA-binding protein
MTQSERLHRLLHERMEDHFELWDLLEQVKIGGFEPRRLLSALPGEPHHICGIVPPMLPRLGHGSTLTIDIALDVGYSDLTTFYAHFKSRFGDAPKQVA